MSSVPPPPPPRNPPSKNPAPPPPRRLSIAVKNADVQAAMKVALETSEKGGRPGAGDAGDKTREVHSAFKGDELNNPDHDWLKYESIYNHIQFQHTAQRLPFAAYLFPLDKLRIILLPGLSDTALTRIRTAFFPSLADNAALQACCFKPWDADYKPTVEANAKGGNQNARMPYNAVCNDITARALGTRAIGSPAARNPTGPPAAPAARKLNGEWAMWQTASRSCVIELASSDVWSRDPTPLLAEGGSFFLPWEFSNDADRIKGYRDVKPTLKTPRTVKKVSELKDAGGEPTCFGIKTGVVYVGSVNQNSADSGDKGTLEKDSLVAALQSNYVIAIEQFLEAQGSKGAKALVNSRAIAVLPEVLTVTCTDPALDGDTTDGFQLRDLSRLSKDWVYFPPLSIPYVGRTAVPDSPVNFDVRSEYFAGLATVSGAPPGTEVDWATYWSGNFAGLVGKAKAILHLVYGLQPLTPNAQNFLLEISPDMKSTRRVVCRDILDMKLHSDWVVTMFGTNPLDPVPRSLVNVEFKGFSPVTALLKYEKTSLTPQGASLIGGSETFGDKEERGAPYYGGTQLNWFPYTSLHRGSAVASGGSKVASAGTARPPGWQKILSVNAEWGLAHAVSYASTINDLLSLPAKLIDPGNFAKGIPLAFTRTKLQDRLDGVEYAAVNAAGKVTIRKGAKPDPAPFDFQANVLEFATLSGDEKGYKRAGQLHDLFWKWERSLSDVIHKAIYDSKDVRVKLREFHGL